VSTAKVLLASIVWLVILAIGILLYRLWWKPAADELAMQREQEIVNGTSGTSNYQHHVKLGLDAFSGYAVLRSPELAQQLRAAGIKLEPVDDGADYAARLTALAEGKLKLAAFPIDALLKACEARKTLPATIIALIDETRGADALLAYRSRFPRIDSLNTPDTRFVLVSGSPSETLFRVLLHDFKLDALSPQALVPVSSPEELLRRYRESQPDGHEVFITWEPLVSQLKANQEMQVLLDTSRQSGYIVDALVVSRDYLIKNEAVVRQILEAYFRVLHSVRNRQDMLRLVERDAATLNIKLTAEQASSLVDGIQWKNTQENFAHFGLRQAPVPHIEDLIDRIKGVLLDTHGLASDPTQGDSSKLFFEQPLRELHASGFHPGIEAEDVRADNVLSGLTEEQWQTLVSVGTISQPPLVFARGSDRLTEASQRSLDDLVLKLESWPMYYVQVVGSAGTRGDLDANRRLSLQRAEAAVEYLKGRGVPPNRLKAVGERGSSELGGDMSVSFVFGQLPY
jgi:outer membrane protein OmpA-like peptidoglycan-associated protein/ABC-type nitrate/sulfonate/bicarbonate transport system substrate-binding protein